MARRARTPGIEDILVDEPRVLFVGINPGSRSGALGHHFAGKGNPFWRLMHASGLTPVLLAPEEDRRLAEFGHALTNLCPRTTRTAAELGREELQRGARALRQKVERLRPRVVALVGLTLYPLVFGERCVGAGAKDVRLGEARVFVLPNPSGLNASFPASRRSWCGSAG